MAQNDYLGLKGFGQVVPTTNSNLYALANLTQRAQAHKDDLLQKKQEADQSWFDGQAKLGFPEVRSELSSGLREVLNDTYQGMTNIYRNGMTANRSLDPTEKQTIGDLKTNYNTFSGLVKNFDNDLTKVEDLIKNDKEKVFNQPAFSAKLKQVIDGTFERDPSGKIVSINPSQAQKLSEITSDPDIYDDAALSNQYIKQLGQTAVDDVQNKGSYFETNKQEFTSGLYETEKGKMKLDKNTGLPIPKATGESIMLWDSDPVRKSKLDRWAQSMTKEGQPWEKNRNKAFEKFVVDKFGTFKENKSVQGNSAYSSGDAENEAMANTRYMKALRPAVYDMDQSALSQAFSSNDRVKAEFTGPNGPNSKNNAITIFKREVVYPSQMAQMTDMDAAPRYSEWIPFKTIPLHTESDKESALFELNNLMDNAGVAKNAVGNDRIRNIHDKYKKTAPKKSSGAFDDL